MLVSYLIQMWLLLATAACQGSGAEERAQASLLATVRNASTGAPVSGALVTLRLSDKNIGYQQLSDAEGHATFLSTEEGEYLISAEAAGFARDVQAAFSPAARVTLRARETGQTAEVRLSPLATISGKVVDSDRAPVQRARVELLRYAYSRAGKRLSMRHYAISDDHGEFRIPEIPAGMWFLRASKQLAPPTASGEVHTDLPDEAYADSYYPNGDALAGATALDVPPGAALTGMDLKMRKTGVYHVRGRAVAVGSGQPVGQAKVYLGEWYVVARPDGSFDFRGMFPGTYALRAEIKGAASLYSPRRDLVIVDKDLENIDIGMEPVFAIAGEAGIDGASPEGLSGVRIGVQDYAEERIPQNTRIQANGQFRIEDATAQRYCVRAEPARGRYIKSIRYGVEDISVTGCFNASPGQPLAVVFGSKPGSVRATLPAPVAKTAPQFFTLVSAVANSGRADLAQTEERDEDGMVEFEGLAPGEYRLYTWDLPDHRLADYAGLRELLAASSVAVTVREGELTVVAAKAISAADVQMAMKRLQ